MNYDFIFKIILVGDSTVGKTSFIHKFCNDIYNGQYNITIGVEFEAKIIVLDINNKNIRIKLYIWDTAGQERFRSITKNYYKDTAGIILCYDTTSIITFDHLNNWLKDIKSECSSDVKIILVGTKTDLTNLKQVKTEDGLNYANEHNLPFYEASAKNNINVKEVFHKLVADIYNGYMNGEIKHGVKKINNSDCIVIKNEINTIKKCC